MANNARLISMNSVKTIMQKRITIPEDAVGKRVLVMVQGDGNVIDVKNKLGELVLSTLPGQQGVVLQKKLFNLRANSGIAMANSRNHDLLREAVTLEKAGKLQEASDKYNAYLNAVQISFGVILPLTGPAARLAANVEVIGTVEKVTTDNGSLLTIDPNTISVKEPEVYGATTFNIDDFLGTAATGATADEVFGSKFDGMTREQLAAYNKEHNLGVKLVKSMTDDQIREALKAAETAVEEEI